MTGPLDVLVAIPAHDEQESIGRCLDSVRAAVIIAQQAGVVGRARLAVAAHRCVDETVARVRQWLVEHSGTEGLLVEDADLKPVGAVRTELITTAMSVAPVLAPSCWILSTDADTIVPIGWITGLLAAARSESADLVAGLADLDGWAAPDGARRVYAEIVDAGIVGRQHRHVYAANLAVSWSAFRAVGGFPAVAHGEEHELVAAVRASGRRVVSPLGPRVRTSARMPGRAAEGLGDLLAGLVADVATDAGAPSDEARSAR